MSPGERERVGAFGQTFYWRDLPKRDPNGAPLAQRMHEEPHEPPTCGRCGVEYEFWHTAETAAHPMEQVPAAHNYVYRTALYRPRCSCWRLGTDEAVGSALIRGHGNDA